MSVVQSAISSIRKKASEMFNDDQGWFRGGNFTPGKQISEFKVGNNPTLGQAFQQVTSQGLNKAFNPYDRIASDQNNNMFLRGGADVVNQGLKSYVNSATLGLVTPQMGEQQTSYGTIGKVTGFIGGMGASPLGKVMSGSDRLMAKIAPQATGLLPKIARGVGSEAIQTIGYAGASALGSKLGLNEQTDQFSPKNLATNFALGSAFRGVLSPQVAGKIRTLSTNYGGQAQRKIMNPKDISELDIARDIINNKKSDVNSISMAKKTIANLADIHLVKSASTENFDYKGMANDLSKIAKQSEQLNRPAFAMGFAQSERTNLKNTVNKALDIGDPINPDINKINQASKNVDDIYNALINSKKDKDFINKVKALRARYNEQLLKVTGADVSSDYKTNYALYQNARGTNIPQSSLLDNLESKISNLDEIITNKGKTLEPYQSERLTQPIKTGGEVKVNEGIDIPSRNLTQQAEISPSIKQTELLVPNKVSQSQYLLSLPEGEIKQQVVRTKAQLKKVLAKNPNANVRIELTPSKGKIATLGQVPDRADVQATLPNRMNTFVEDVLGYSTKAPKGGKRQASLYTKTLRGVQEKISTGVEEAMGSENPYIRQGATMMQNFFRGLGMSPERAKASMELRGEMSVANERAYDVMDTLYKSLGNNKKSLERINAVLDPDISKTKVTFDQLSKSEKQAYGLIREGLDLVHDTSYANGHISPELYVKNKGKYTPRLYEVTELPPEVNKFVTQGKKLNNDLYKQRKDVDVWKQDNSLNDPVYALGKRLSQVETNSAIKKYTDFLSQNQRFVSDIERPGFVKLSDSPAYGALSGKYVLNSAAEDLKGFFFSNQAMQNLYDVFRAYDRLPIRQLQKKLLTVFNPTTNVGNIVSDQVFGWVTGIDPFTLNKNLLGLKNNPKQFKQLSDYLMRQGITGTDITRTDFINKLGSIDELAKGKKAGKFKLATDKVQKFYGGTDDAYKISAFKSLLDKGFSLEEATRKVSDGFQNYANVGKYYDLAAKTPLIGKPFIKFQGDLIRIIKNGAINNPLGLISFLGALKGVSYLSSKLSGETDEDRETRENRFAAPMIPGLNIPLTWQTPIGEINVARYISPFFANNETTNIASNMLPFVPNIDSKKDTATKISQNINDPLLSPLIQMGLNRDFRGKPISDPDENKYQPSTLTPGEKLKNRAMFVGRAYTPPPINSAIDVGQVASTGENMYGTPQTLGQSIARLGGVKISQYGPEEVQGIREKDAKYDQKGNEFIQKQIQSVKKLQLTGKISQETASNRITNLESQKKEVDTSLIKGAGDEIPYINESGSMLTINLKKFDDISNLPTDNKYNSAIKESKQYSEAAKIMDNTALDAEQQQTALDRLGIDKTKADYYRVANDSDNLKTMFVLDAVNKVKTQGGGFSDVIQLLANQRTEVNGKQIASKGVLDNLVDEGILTKAQATEINKYKFENGQLIPKSKTGTKAKKAKKINVTLRKMSAPKLSSTRTKVKRITVPKKTYKRLKPKKLKILKLPSVKS